jgi:hypothetical protein
MAPKAEHLVGLSASLARGVGSSRVGRSSSRKHLALFAQSEHAVGQQGVMMNVEIEARSQAMREADRAGPRALRAFAAGLLALSAWAVGVKEP